jgi:Secretion system C-terminal sorting domain
MLNFSVKKESNSAKLNWETTNELNTSHFEIERSLGKINFVTIGKVLANNQKEKNGYNFLDENPETGLFYYRLKMVDLDGKYSYSPIRSVLFENAESEFTVFPSPADQSVIVDLKKPFSRIKAEIISSIGKELGSKRLIDTQKFEMDVSNLSPGIYFIRITESAGVKEIKFLKR